MGRSTKLNRTTSVGFALIAGMRDVTIHVKVDSASKHGNLLDMLQILIDLDLVISKSYISSDGGRSALCATRGKLKYGLETCLGRSWRPSQISTTGTTLEITTFDKPGLLSVVSAVLAGLGCHVT